MSESERPGWVLPARLALGLAQGLVLYLLYRAYDAQAWPATDPFAFAPLLLIALYIPLLVSQAMGTIRLPTLLIWAAAATAIIAWVGWYDRDRLFAPGMALSRTDSIPSFGALFFGFAALFIAQALVVAGDAERTWLARYETYFDVAWKQVLQGALAAVFVGVFWLVLWLGAALFNLIKLDFLEKLLEKDWFWIPATALATAAAIELTDVRARLISGIRGLVHTLLGWLLPLMAPLAVGFLGGLLVTGLAPLWATRAATAGLLGAIAVLVILINAVYQDGAQERLAILRAAQIVGMLVLAPLATLAAYALFLRVHQYGWTVDRLATLNCVIVAIVFAGGYALAAILNRTRQSPILEFCNIACAVLVLVLLASHVNRFTDPMKIATDDQISRLRNGQARAAQFDYLYLSRETGRFGHRALSKLATATAGPDAALIRVSAKLALTPQTTTQAPGKADLTRNLTVYPLGKQLPASFLAEAWDGRTAIPACLTIANFHCDAVLLDLDGDGADEVLLITGQGTIWWGTAMRYADGHWSILGTLPGPHCEGDIAALHAGAVALVPYVAPSRDIRIGDHVLSLTLPDRPAPLCAR